MAKHTITYNQLFAIDQDMERLRKNSPALMLLLNKDINNYLKGAKTDLDILYKKMHEVQLKYIEQDENGNLETYKVNDETHFKFKRTVTSIRDARILTGNEVENAYMNEVNAFLERSCTIEL